MANTTRSAATERAYLHFAPAPHAAAVVASPAAAGAGDEDFDESDVWGMFAPAEQPRARTLRAARKAAAAAAKPAPAPATVQGDRASHGSLPVKIPDWSKILGEAYRGHHGGAWEWEVDDADDEDSEVLIPPHELAWRRRAASLSLSLNGVLGRTLKMRDAVWKHTTGFQD